MQIIFWCFLGLLVSVNAGYEYPKPSIRLGTPIQISQYQTQDALGQYSYGYSEPLSSKQEIRTADGITRGTYSYVDAGGKLQTVDYTADAVGFRVSATNLPNSDQVPKSVEETPEVAALRAQHLEAHAEAKLRLAGGESNADFRGLPRPVEDTPEVALAKVEFFKRFEAEKLRNQLLRRQYQSPNLVVGHQPIVVKTSSLPVYKATLVPSSGFAYNYQTGVGLTVPGRGYLPVV